MVVLAQLGRPQSPGGDCSTIAVREEQRHGSLAAIAAVAGVSFVVHVGEDRSHEPDHRGGVGEDPDQTGAALDLLVHPLQRFVDQIFCQCARGSAVKARTSVLASSISGPVFGNALVSLSRTSSQVSLTAST
jgi:hypothetical protein